MKKSILISCLLISFFVCTIPAHAIGIGLYGSFAGGNTFYGRFSSGVYSGEYELNAPTKRITTSHVSGGGGFILDTNCSKNELFNYRLMVGFEKLFSQRYYVKQMTRINIFHTFGFGVFRVESFRLWLGPQLSLHYLYGVNNYPIKELFVKNISGTKLEISKVGAGLGITIGMNFNLDPLITLSCEGGARGIIYYGVVMEDNIMLYSSFSNIQVPITESRWGISSTYEGYIAFSILFRIKEAFIQ